MTPTIGRIVHYKLGPGDAGGSWRGTVDVAGADSMTRPTRIAAAITAALALVAGVVFVAGPARATDTEPAGVTLARQMVRAYCTDMLDDATTTALRNERAAECTLWTRELSDRLTAVTPSPSTSPSSGPTPSPTASPTASPTPSPSPTTPTSSWPTAATTGVPAGTTLRVTSGRTITTAGTVIDGEDVRGCLTIEAANVVVRRSKVTCATSGAAIDVNVPGAFIENTEVTCSRSPGSAIVGSFTASRVNLHDCENGAFFDGPGSIVASFVHDLYEQANPLGHTDAVQVWDGVDDVLVYGNYLSNLTPNATSAFMGDGPGMDRIRINSNYLRAGGYVVYCPASGSGDEVTGNTIDPSGYGPYYRTCTDNTALTLSGNTLL